MRPAVHRRYDEVVSSVFVSVLSDGGLARILVTLTYSRRDREAHFADIRFPAE
jgi:hypothetical protein